MDEARQQAVPYLRPLREAEAEVQGAEAALRDLRAAMAGAPRWRRRGLTAQLRQAEVVLDEARSGRDSAEQAAAPYAERVEAAEVELREAERVASVARVRDRLEHFSLAPPARGIGRDVGVDRSIGIEL